MLLHIRFFNVKHTHTHKNKKKKSLNNKTRTVMCEYELKHITKQEQTITNQIGR